MKILLFIAFFSLMGTFNAQGNLQFNQVLLLSASANNTTQWTVPAGKSWKIESMGCMASSMYVYWNNTMAFEFVGDFNNNLGAYYRGSDAGPIWLPSGTVLGHFSNNSSAFRWFSIIEFNLVP